MYNTDGCVNDVLNGLLDKQIWAHSERAVCMWPVISCHLLCPDCRNDRDRNIWSAKVL